MAQTKVKLISDGVIVQSNLHASHGITTAHIGEGSNLYYTDARVSSYLSTNSFATESYVGTQITNLVDSSPATLNTLNELAAALGDDPNFATTTATSIGLKAPLASPSFTGNSTFAGNVGIGAAASDGNLHVRKTGVNTGITNVLMNANFADGSNGTGLSIGYRTDETTAVIAARTATGNIAFYSYDAGWSESMRIKNNGNVGIGTASPGRKLTVTGDASGDANNLLLANENDTDGDSASIGFSMLSNNTYVKSGIFFKRTTTQGRGDLIFANNNEVNGNNVTLSDAKMTIQPSGNVGIGQTNPQFGLSMAQGTGDGNRIGWNDGAGDKRASIICSSSTDALQFHAGTSDTERMRIGSSGDVRITTNGKFLQGIRNTGSAAIDMIGFVSGTDTLQIKGGTSGAANAISFYDTGGFIGTWYNGSFGIGTTSPAGKLEIKTGSSYTGHTQPNIKLINFGYRDSELNVFAEGSYFTHYFENYSGGNGRYYDRSLEIVCKGSPDGTYGEGVIKFKANPINAGSNVAEIMRITGAGKVGIGTASPNFKLNVHRSDSTNTTIGITNSSTGDARLYFDASNGDGAGSDYMQMGQQNDLSGFIQMEQSAGSFNIKTGPGGSDRLTVLQGGNVGIGTTSPLNKLQVNGDIGIGEINSARSTNVRFAKNDVNVITFDISVAAIGAWRPGSCWIQVSGTQNGLQEYWSAWYFIRLTHYYASGVAGEGTTNPSCILDSGGDTSRVVVGVSSTNSSNPQIITITLTDVGGSTNSMVADINCTMQVGINSIT